MQVTDQERQAMQESMFRDVAAIIAEKCMNPENNRTYTVSMIQSAMKQIHYGVNLNKSAKSQALDAIKKLKSVMPLARAPMSLRIVHPSSQGNNLKAELDTISGIVMSTLLYDNRDRVIAPPDASLKEAGASLDTQTPTPPSTGSSSDTMQSCRFHADPDCYRRIQDSVKKLGDARIYVEVIALNALASPTPSIAVAGVGAPSHAGNVEIVRKGGDGEGDEDGANLKEVSKVTEVREDKEEDITAEGMVRARCKGRDKKKEKRRAKQAATATIEEDEGEDEDEDEDEDEEGDVDPADEDGRDSVPTISDSKPKEDKKKGKGKGTGDDMEKGKSGGKQGKKAKRQERSRASEDRRQREELLSRLEAERKRAEERRSGSQALATPEVGGAGTSSGGITGTVPVSTGGAAEGETLKPCTTCGGAFDKMAFREHFRSEWHRFNLQRKMNGEDILKEADFLTLSLS